MSQTTTAAPAPTQEASRTPIMSHRQIMLVILGLMAGMFLSSLDQTIVSTAIRTIGDDLQGLDQQAWVTTAYMIASTVTTPIYGKLSDIFGRRPLYLFGIGVFILGSLLSSFATSMLELAAFRAFQGLGAGALMSLPLAIMADMLAPRERAKYQGYFLAIFGVSSVLGPLIGGIFAGTEQILWISGWRWVFLVNVPIGIVAFVMVWFFLRLPKVGKDTAKPVVDWWGATFVILALVPMLLVAEQGREWGWDSGLAITCYVLGAVGIALFIITEMRMGKNALLPLKLFSSFTFSMATVLGFFVGFGMFGAMMTIPLYLQIVTGLTPTQSGFAMIPITVGIMSASIASGLLISKTGKYRIFPVIGTFLMAVGYILLTFMTVDRPLWYLMIAMFLIGLGLGQLMQTLTLASQNAVQPQDMGVATSGATFFRQIGGTLGTAVLLSVLFSNMPGAIQQEMGNEQNLKTALYAATDPSIAGAAENQGVMNQMWNDVVNPLKANIQTGLDSGTSQALAAADQAVTEQVTQAVQQQVDAGAIPADTAQTVIAEQVQAAKPAAEEQALNTAAEQAHASVVDGKLAVDWSNADQRTYWVDQVAPELSQKITEESESGSGTQGSVGTSDTSFLTGANPQLTRPFMLGFNQATITVYWVGFIVIALAFALTWFFKVPPLREQSALQEQADEELEAESQQASPVPASAEQQVVRANVTATGALPIIPAPEPVEQDQSRAGEGSADGASSATSEVTAEIEGSATSVGSAQIAGGAAGAQPARAQLAEGELMAQEEARRLITEHAGAPGVEGSTSLAEDQEPVAPQSPAAIDAQAPGKDSAWAKPHLLLTAAGAGLGALAGILAWKRRKK